MSHVFTLTMTGSKVPRWFTEGIAVHEETAASPEWGDRLGPEEIVAVKDYALLPIAELDRGFIHPSYPQQVVVSYFQGGKICDFITEKWGWDTILAMLHDYAHGEETPDIIRKELKVEPAEFDKQFRAYVEAATKTPVQHFTEWKDGLKRLAALCRSHVVALVVRFGPIWEGVAQSRDFRQLDEWSDEFEQTGAIVRRPVVAAWDRESMWDCLHLNAHGVSRFAPIVARDVQQALNLPAR